MDSVLVYSNGNFINMKVADTIEVDNNKEVAPIVSEDITFTIDETKLDAEIESRSNSDEFYAIELKKEQKVIGNIYLGHRDFNTRELGYVLNKNYLHMGYGSAAALAAIRYAFSIGVHRVYAETCPENNAS